MWSKLTGNRDYNLEVILLTGIWGRVRKESFIQKNKQIIMIGIRNFKIKIKAKTQAKKRTFE